MMCFIERLPAQAAFTLTATLLLGAVANSALAQTSTNPYTAGNLVVSGVDTSGTTGSAGAITLYQYTTSGAVKSTLKLPTTSSVGVNPLTISNNSTSEGALTLSTGGDYLTIGGYDAPTGTANIANSAGTTAQREVGTISTTGTVNTSTLLGSTAYSGSNIRSSVYDDAGLVGTKTSVFTGGTASSSANGYVRTTMLGSTSVATQVESTTSNVRIVNIFKNVNNNPTLYYSTGSGTTGIYSVANPSAMATATLIATTGNQPYDFAFANGGLTLYVADNTSGLQKYTSATGAANSFSLAYTASVSGLTGLTFDGTNTLYAVNGTSLISFLDSGSSTLGFTQTVLATAATNTAFRGVDFAPTDIAATPAPPGVVSAGIGFGVMGLSALLRRRRQSKSVNAAEAAA